MVVNTSLSFLKSSVFCSISILPLSVNNGITHGLVNEFNCLISSLNIFINFVSGSYGNLISVTKVDTTHVCGTNGLMKRVILSEGGAKYKSTNGNGVGVHYENGGVREGEIVYLNDIRK